MPVFKVTPRDRSTKVTVCAINLTSLKQKAASKLNMDGDPVSFQIFDETDGCIIDDEECLIEMAEVASSKGGQLFTMILKSGEQWPGPQNVPLPATPPHSRPSSPTSYLCSTPQILQFSMDDSPGSLPTNVTPLRNRRSEALPSVSQFVNELNVALNAPEFCRNRTVRAARRKVAQKIRDIFINCQCNPGDIMQYCKKIYVECPRAFQVNFKSNYVGNGLAAFAKSVYNMIGYHRQMTSLDVNVDGKVRKRKQQSLESSIEDEPEEVLLLCLDWNGCAEGMWDPLVPPGVDREDLERKKIELLEYLKMPGCEDDFNAKSLVKATYPLQRHAINRARTIEEWRTVFSSWSVLSRKTFLLVHCDILMGKKCSEVWYSELAGCKLFLTFMHEYCDSEERAPSKKTCYGKMKDYICYAQEAEKHLHSNLPITIVMIPLLILYMKEVESNFFLIVEKTATSAIIFQKAKEVSFCPLLVVKGSSLFDVNAEYSVIIRGEFEIVVKDFIEGALIVLLSYFAFNISYPQTLCKSLEFLQRFFLLVNPHSMTRHETKKKTGVHPAVARLASCLQDMEGLRSRWAAHQQNV